MAQESEAVQLAADRAKYGFNRQDLEAKGERSVSDDLDSGKYGDQRLAPAAFVSAWLADKEFARREEAISIARDANAIALRAMAAVRYDRYITIAAVIIAAIAAHKEINWLVSSVMSWFL